MARLKSNPEARQRVTISRSDRPSPKPLAHDPTPPTVVIAERTNSFDRGVWIAARYIAIILCCFFVGATAGLVYILFFAPDSPLITPVPVTSEEPSGPELELKSCGIRTKKPFDNETATETDGRIDYEPTGRIYNGKLANLYEYPFLVGILIWGKFLGENFTETWYFCSGSLLNRRFILTNGECATIAAGNVTTGTLSPTFNYTIHIGTTMIPLVPNLTEYEIDRALPHELYQNRTPSAASLNDIGLLRLSKPLDEPEPPYQYNGICLPKRNIVNETKLELEFAGFGLAKNFTKPQDWDGQLRKGKMLYEAEVNFCDPNGRDNLLCMAWNENQSSYAVHCSGDEGGPLMWRDESDRVEQVGIALLVDQEKEKFCASPSNLKRTFINIYPYLDWIKRKMLDNWEY